MNRNRFLVRFSAIIMALVLSLVTVVGFPAVSVHAEEKTNVTIDDMKKSINNVISSIDQLKDMMTAEEQETLADVFSGSW